MGKTVEIKRGDTIVQIAKKNGFRAWQPIWNHEENAKLRAQRPNPYVLAKGDKLFVPDKTVTDYNCQTNLRHVFRVRNMKQFLRQVILDESEQPMAGKTYELKAGGKTAKGKTDSAGLLDEEIPLDATTAEIKVWRKDGDDESCLTWNLQLGHMEPVENVYGLKSHLSNLGYDCGEVNDDFDEKTKKALMEFQQDHNLPSTGKNDEATQQALLSLHDYPLEGSH
jgi:N-acetylmuramoyl-L-alanine amidase